MVPRVRALLPPTFGVPLPCRWVGILVLYAVHKGQFSCPGGALLHSYLLVLLALLAAIICTLSALVYVSMQGTRFGATRCSARLAQLEFVCVLLLWSCHV